MINSWKGLFTENEAKLLVDIVNNELIKNDKHNNRGNLKIAVNEMLGSTPVRDSIINKIESLNQEQVNEIINACTGLTREENKNELQSVFNPQEGTFQK
jgi:hypothetical protein